MTKTEFKRMIRSNFDPVLTTEGFSCGGRSSVIYWRKINDEIYHFIVVSTLQGDARYQIVVFGSSPIIEDEFECRFPNDLHIVNAPRCYLSPEDGISDHQKLYFCGNPDAFMSSFKRDAGPALTNIAVPYLDNIQTIEDLIPTIRPAGMMGAALLHVGRTAEAKQYVESEIKRLSELPLDKLGQVERALAFQRGLLARIPGTANSGTVFSIDVTSR